MARERDKAEWNRIASLIAQVRNSFRGDGKATQPDECTPYGKPANRTGSIPLRRDNIHMLKELAGMRSQ